MNSDQDRRDRVRPRQRAGAFARIERVPLRQMVLLLALAAITVMFGVLVVLYIQTRAGSDVERGLHPFPRYFSLSTLVLLVSSYTLAQAPRLYAADDVASLARCLGATLLLGAIFGGLQALGWRELQQQGVFFRGVASGTYVYFISALHVMHLLGGMLFMLALLVRTAHASRDSIRELVFIRNPYWRQLIRLMSIYWHFIDALWVVLFAVFLLLY